MMPSFSLNDNKKVHELLERFFRWFVVGIVVLVGAGGWGLVISPQIHRLRTSGLLAYDQRVALRDAKRQELLELQNLEKQYGALNMESLQRLSLTLPQGFDEAATIARMEQFAENAGVQLKNIDVTTQDAASGAALTPELPSTTVPSEAPGEGSTLRAAMITFTVDLQQIADPYLALKKFLQELESFVPLMDLRDLAFTANQTVLTLQLQTPYLSK